MNQNISHLFGAVDGGGTGCRVRLALGDGVPLAQATGGPANYTTDAAQAVSNITDALTRATAQLSCPQQICALHVGLAGILTQDDARDMAARLGFDHCTVSDDRLTTAVGALGDRDGAVLALGTGGFSALRRDGNLRFIGGWGLKVGDQASGAWLGRAVLEHTLLAHDGLAPHSDLTQHILARFGTPAGIVAFAAQAAPAEFATLAPALIKAAQAGDATGVTLMRRGADYLNTTLLVAQLAKDDVICLTGGVGPHYAPYLAAPFQDRICPPQGAALDGALALAQRQAIK